jgi:ubiquinone/menaquinone biosynthesis C-methylase UbiE
MVPAGAGWGSGLEKALLENHKRYLERIALYKRFGYDVERERCFIIEKAEPLYGDILEVGTGKGYFTVALAEEGYEFTSLDISAEEQEFARLNLRYSGLEKQVDFRIGNAESLPFHDGSFDVVITVNAMHHFISPFKVLDEFMRVLSFEGKIVLSDFNQKGMQLVAGIHEREARKHQAEPFDLHNAGRYLAAENFRIEIHQSTFQTVLIAYHQLL